MKSVTLTFALHFTVYALNPHLGFVMGLIELLFCWFCPFALLGPSLLFFYALFLGLLPFFRPCFALLFALFIFTLFFPFYFPPFCFSPFYFYPFLLVCPHSTQEHAPGPLPALESADVADWAGRQLPGSGVAPGAQSNEQHGFRDRNWGWKRLFIPANVVLGWLRFKLWKPTPSGWW